MMSAGSERAGPQRIDPTRNKREARHVDALLTEEAAQERSEGHHDDVGDDVPGADPGDLLHRRPQRPHHVRQRDGDDRRVDCAHQRPEGDRQRDDPLVGTGRTARAAGAARRRKADESDGAAAVVIASSRREPELCSRMARAGGSRVISRAREGARERGNGGCRDSSSRHGPKQPSGRVVHGWRAHTFQFCKSSRPCVFECERWNLMCVSQVRESSRARCWHVHRTYPTRHRIGWLSPPRAPMRCPFSFVAAFAEHSR